MGKKSISKEKLSELATGIKEIREKWNKSATVSSKIDHNFQKEFSKLNESFNYNFNIYKELKENDLKRNFSLKNQIIHELKELNSINDIKKIQLELKLIQNKWEEIGPVNSKNIGTNDNMFSFKLKFGLPPIFIGQSIIIMYLIPIIASIVPVKPYMNAVIASLVGSTPIIESIPCNGIGE